MNSIDQDIKSYFAPAAAAAFVGAMEDGSLGDMDYSDAFAFASSAPLSPTVTAPMSKTAKRELAPDEVRSVMMDQYWDEVVKGTMASGMNRSEETALALEGRRRDAIFAGVSREEANRVAFDSAHGDGSALLRLKEDFYFS